MRKPGLISYLIAIIALGAGVLILLATPWGPGLREDSFSYITAAQSYAQGTGLGRWAADGTFRPLTHFPPLLPLLFAGIKQLGFDLVGSFRVLNGVLFSSIVILTALSIYVTSRSEWGALAGALLTASSGVLIENFTWAHSEPLYLTLSIAGLILLSIYMSSKKNNWYFAGSIVAVALAFLTRFAGIALIVSSGLILAVMPWTTLKRRLGITSVFSASSALPTAAFMVRNRMLYGTASDRPTPLWHPPELEKWMEGARTILSWFLPHRLLNLFSDSLILILGATALTAIFALASLTSIRYYRRLKREELFRTSLWYLLFTNAVGYLGLVLLTVLFLDRLTPLNDRIMVPFYLFLLPLLTTSVIILCKGLARLRLPVTVLTVGFILLHGYRGIQTIEDLRERGLGLSTPGWHTSEAIAYLRSLPQVPIYTNDIPAVYFHADRMAHFIPVRVNPAEGSLREDYQNELEEMRERLSGENGILILFGESPRARLHSAELEDVTRSLYLVWEFEDALVYRPKK
ncbi:MAG: hypothetical protein P1P76_02135 [Anaerolineales bacterium]|nr:hypothetical protein [Anaerolineales bacterium]